MLNTGSSSVAPGDLPGGPAERSAGAAHRLTWGKSVLAGGLTVTIAVVSLTGCSSSTTSSPAPNAALFAPPVSAVQQMEIQTADSELVRVCMTKHGFEYPTAPLSLKEFISGPANVDPLYTDTTDFRTEGYGIYKNLSVGGPKDNVSSDPNVQ